MRQDFYLTNGRIYTWAPIAGTSLARIATTAANENPVGELWDGTPEQRRLLVGLLNAALRHDLRETCEWSNSRKFIYFKATEDLKKRKVTSSTGRPRIAFNGYYQRKDDPSRREFYRHAALRWNSPRSPMTGSAQSRPTTTSRPTGTWSTRSQTSTSPP